MSERDPAVAHALRDERRFRGGVSTVRDWVRAHLRRETAAVPGEAQTATVRPSSRRAAWLLSAPPQRLNVAERCYVAAVCVASPALARVRALALAFRRLFEIHDPNTLASWLTAAERSDLHSLAVSLRRDRDAVSVPTCCC
jgi:hypothetical protein